MDSLLLRAAELRNFSFCFSGTCQNFDRVDNLHVLVESGNVHSLDTELVLWSVGDVVRGLHEFESTDDTS